MISQLPFPYCLFPGLVSKPPFEGAPYEAAVSARSSPPRSVQEPEENEGPPPGRDRRGRDDGPGLQLLRG